MLQSTTALRRDPVSLPRIQALRFNLPQKYPNDMYQKMPLKESREKKFWDYGM